MSELFNLINNMEVELRGIVDEKMSTKSGSNWIEGSGLSKKRIANANMYQSKDSKVKSLVEYTSLDDLKIIIDSNKDVFSDVFDDFNKLEVYLSVVIESRNPTSHSRHISILEKQQLAAATGYINSKIVLHRNSQDSIDAVFPRIISVTDSIGNEYSKSVLTGIVLHPGETISLEVVAIDPRGGSLEYKYQFPAKRTEWLTENTYTHRLTEEDIGKLYRVVVQIRSSTNSYHSHSGFDDILAVSYSVLPVQRK